MRRLVLIATLMLVGCLRNASLARSEEDTSIVMPEFDAQFPVVVGKPGQVYELDGVTLKALMIALTDRYPPEAQARSCWNRPESQEYRIIRQGDEGGFDSALLTRPLVSMGLFELVQKVAEGGFRFRRSLPFLFADIFLAKRRNEIGHLGYFFIVA